MKNSLLRIFYCLIAVTIGLAPLTNSQAQVYTTCPGTDEFAIFFENGDINFDAQANVPVTIYYAIVGPSAGCVSGFEFRLNAPSDPLYFVLSEVFNGNAINVGISPDYVVGFGAPLPTINNQVLVMTQQVLLIDNRPRQYSIEPTSIPSVPGAIVYVDCNDFSNLVPMRPVSGDFALPVAQLNSAPLSYCNQPAPLDLSVYIGFDGDNDNIAGTSEGATDGFDSAYDLADQNLSLTFPHPEWAADAGNYRHDIKAAFDPTREVRQWTFVASAQVAQSDARYVSLDFQPNFTANPDLDFQLYDRATGVTHDLFTQNNFQYYIVDGETFNRTFDLFIGREVVVEPNLWVDVTASNYSFSEATNRLSTDPAATDGYDPGLDIPEPTPPPSNFVSSSFIHADWPLGPRFRTDTRAVFDPTLETKTWPLRVETDQSGQIVLDFAAGFTAADDIGLKLYDRQSGQSFNLFPQMNYAFEANGISTYWFDISVGASGPPIPAPTSRYIGTGWALVGMPLMPIFRSLDDVILDQTPGYGFMFEHQPGLGYNLLEASTIARQDQGYWLATDSAFTWTMTGQPNLSGETVSLTPGWNLVGNPMWFPGPFEGMAVIRNGATIPWLQAVSSGLVATGVQSYNQNTGGYFDAVDLQPFHGYWINALVPDLQLVFRWENFQNLPARLTANKAGIPVDERVWSADLTLWDSKRLQTTITMGFNPEATEGFDSRFDMPMAPTPPSGGPIMAFTRPEWGLASGAYFSRDVMPISDNEVVWNAVISVENPGTANLIWDSSSWPKNADFQIYLPTENRVVVMSMRAQSSVQFEIGEAPLPIVIRTPSMATGVEDIPVLAYKVSVYPNPFNPMTTVNFDLPRGGDVEIRLYSVRGELVNVLAGEHYVAGSHKVVWQGTDRSGRNLPSGSYFAKLFVDGEAMGSVTKMSLVR